MYTEFKRQISDQVAFKSINISPVSAQTGQIVWALYVYATACYRSLFIHVSFDYVQTIDFKHQMIMDFQGIYLLQRSNEIGLHETPNHYSIPSNQAKNVKAINQSQTTYIYFYSQRHSSPQTTASRAHNTPNIFKLQTTAPTLGQCRFPFAKATIYVFITPPALCIKERNDIQRTLEASPSSTSIVQQQRSGNDSGVSRGAMRNASPEENEIKQRGRRRGRSEEKTGLLKRIGRKRSCTDFLLKEVGNEEGRA